MSLPRLAGRIFLHLVPAMLVAAEEPPVVAPASPALPEGLYAVWHTARGTITARLEFELTPLTVANFVGLAEGTLPVDADGAPAGRPFYDGLTFHRVVPGFVAQGGDPLGTGEGNTGYTFADEFSPRLKHGAPGMLAMANSGPNTNSCQFYFTLIGVNRLNYKHTVFGRVVRGLDVVRALEPGDRMDRVEIVRVGARAEAFQPDGAMFARLREAAPVIASRDPELPPLFVNEAVPEVAPWAPAWINEKLHHYHATTGITVRVRTLERLPGSADDAIERLEALHRELAGDDPLAATLVYSADDHQWRVWLGRGLLARVGIAAQRFETPAGRAQLQAWADFVLADARADLEARIMRRSVDAAITGVVEELDRASLAQGERE